MRILAPLSALLVLTGCLQGPAVTKASFGFGFGERAVSYMTVAGGAVTIAGPPGYCIESSATKESEVGAFVLLGSCAAITNSPRLAKPDTPALLTASVTSQKGTTVENSLDRLKSFFESESGRAALSRNGDARSVQVLETLKADGALYLRIRDESPGALPGLMNEYWRGVLDVGDRVVTITVATFRKRPLDPAQALQTLQQFARQIRDSTRANLAERNKEA